MLFSLMIIGVGLAAVGRWTSTTVQREVEAELLRAGDEIRLAIGRYYEKSPGAERRYPRSLDDLVEDTRFVGVVRHLRRVPLEPVTRSFEWGLVKAPDGGVAGVFAPSEARPRRSGPVALNTYELAPASRYQDWKFVYEPRAKSLERK
jgi:hypothetical protein